MIRKAGTHYMVYAPDGKLVATYKTRADAEAKLYEMLMEANRTKCMQ